VDTVSGLLGMDTGGHICDNIQPKTIFTFVYRKYFEF